MTAPVVPPGTPRSWGGAARLAKYLFRQLQHQMAELFGVDEERRSDTVITMLENNARRAPGYWLQLFLSAGIATVGLVLNSTAVVIGAMLVSPLMGPIVELGMGFAVGSSLLVLRAAARVIVSVVGVTLGAALLTLLLPYHEVTAEIATRTTPTALDLLVAVFCALAASYTTVRAAADTTAAAAGTAIGIALVPPLCTVGFGIGTATPAITGGALLLFVANFSAILVFAVATFVLLGFNTVAAPALEERFITVQRGRLARMATRAHEALRDGFGSRYGLFLRLVVPLLFLAAVYVPLSSALDKVAWEVRTRDAIRTILANEVGDAVQSSVSVEQQSVVVRLVLLGSAEQARAMEQRLETAIAAASGVAPVVSVTAVPDLSTLAAAREGARAADRPAPIPIAAARTRMQSAMGRAWPVQVAGPLTSWDIVASSNGDVTVVVRHAGPALGVPAESLLARSLSSSVSSPLWVRDAPIAATPPLAANREPEWLAAATMILDEVARADSSARVVACVTHPASAMTRPSARDRRIAAVLDSSAAERLRRVTRTPGSAWTVRAALRPCAVH